MEIRHESTKQHILQHAQTYEDLTTKAQHASKHFSSQGAGKAQTQNHEAVSASTEPEWHTSKTCPKA